METFVDFVIDRVIPLHDKGRGNRMIVDFLSEVGDVDALTNHFDSETSDA
jgi:hypothetical protein